MSEDELSENLRRGVSDDSDFDGKELGVRGGRRAKQPLGARPGNNSLSQGLESQGGERRGGLVERSGRAALREKIIQLDEFEEEEEVITKTEFFLFDRPIQGIYSARKESDGSYSYLIKHPWASLKKLVWEPEAKLLAARANNKTKLLKFKKAWNECMLPDGQLLNFEELSTQVDRVVLFSDMFSIIHPKKAQEAQNKFSELLLRVLQCMICYEEDFFCFGIHFLHIESFIEEELVERNEFTDFSVLMNLLYTDHYPNGEAFWFDLGRFLGWATKKFEGHPDLLKLCRMMHSLARKLYEEWHDLALTAYRDLIEHKRLFADPTRISSLKIEVYSLFTDLKEENNLEANNKLAANLQLKQEYFASALPDPTALRALFDSLGEALALVAESEAHQNLNVRNALLQCENAIKEQIDLLEIKQKKCDSIEKFNPGVKRFDWLASNAQFEESFPRNPISLKNPPAKKFQVKWVNQSYTDLTWEAESDLMDFEDKVAQFKSVNRTFEKKKRDRLSQQLDALKKYNDLASKPANQSRLREMKDLKKIILERRDKGDPPTFGASNQPIFKDRRLLKDYQIISLNWLARAWKEKRNVILADEMGLGKTVQSMAFLNYLFTFEKVLGPFLVLAPLATLPHWKRTLEDWSNLNCICYYDPNGRVGRQRCAELEILLWEVKIKGHLTQSNHYCKAHVILTSFEVFSQDFDQLFTSLPFQFIIVDEAHRLKNKNAKILQTLKRLVCDRILLLTGTPIQNNIAELWSVLNYLEPKVFFDEQAFLDKFGDVRSEEKLSELKKTLEPYLLRRLKEEVETSIPPLQENIIEIDLTQLQKVVYKTLYEKNKGTLQKGVGLNYISIMNNLEMQLRKCCDHPFLLPEIRQHAFPEDGSIEKQIEALVCSSAKLSFVDKLLLKLKKQNQKALIFSQFTEMLKILEEYLGLRGWSFERIDGSTRGQDRQNAIDRFNNAGPGFGVFLLSTKAGGLGINLTAANTVIIYDSDWNPQNDVQAIARAHRIGQTEEVAVYRLVSKKTYESEMFERASRKLGLDQAIFLGNTFNKDKERTDEAENKRLKPEEIEMLLRKGILGLLESTEDPQADAQNYKNLDIDAIIEKAPKANYSLANGGYTVSKRSVGDKDSKVQIDDPEFWNKVFVEKESPAAKLAQEYKQAKENKRFKNLDFQKNFFLKLFNEQRVYMDQRMKNEGYNTDAEFNFMTIFESLAEDQECVPALKDLAAQFQNNFAKNARRVKQVDPKSIEDLIKKAVEPAQLKDRSRRTKTEGSPKEKNKDKEKEKDKEKSKEKEKEKDKEKDKDKSRNKEKKKSKESLLEKRELPNDHPSQADVFNETEDSPQYKIKRKKRVETRPRYCFACGGSEPDFSCSGACGESFHRACLEEKEKSLLSSSLKDEKACPFCARNVQVCLECGEVGEIGVTEEVSKDQTKSSQKDLKVSVKDSKDPLKITLQNASPSDSKVFKCSACARFYHPRCSRGLKPAPGEADFRCASHICRECDQPGKDLLHCIRCPNSFHRNCSSKKNKILQDSWIECKAHLSSKPSRPAKQASQARVSEPEPKKRVSAPNSSKIYQELKLVPPTEFDYANSKEPWCRYCGARYSDSFSDSEAGPNTLCAKHKKLPKKNDLRTKTPLQLNKNTELEFLTRTKDN